MVLDRKVPKERSTDASDESEGKTFLAKRSPLRIPRDPANLLPAPVPNQPAPTLSDYEAGAGLLGAEVAAVRAVADIESGGRSGFGDDGRAIIRYELHVFQRRTKGAYAKTHPHLSQGYESGKAYHKNGQPNEWSMMYGALLLRGRADDAIASASWGMFQIMGFHASSLGYASTRDFAEAMCLSSANQLDAFLRFCGKTGAGQYLVKKDWAGFALHYNGPKYKDNNYDVLLAAAYRRHGGK